MTKRIEGEALEPLERFLNTHYREDILELVRTYPEHRDLTIDYHDLERFDPDIADEFTEQPRPFIDAFERIFANLNTRDGPQSWDIPAPIDLDDVNVRVINARPNKSIEDLRSMDIGRYLSVTGMVEEVSQVQPEITKAVWTCQRCGAQTETRRVGETVNGPYECQSCEREGPFRIDEVQSEVRDKQGIILQPLPEQSQGNTSDDLAVFAYHDLAGQVSPGDRLRANGILEMDTESMNQEDAPDATRDTRLWANGFEREQASFEELDPQRIEEIEALANDDELFSLLRQSFAPHILTEDYGDLIKLGIILQLFGGVRRDLPNGTQKKADINILMVGEPGTGKSQFISTAEQIAPKGVKASGKNATAAGLTATAERSELTGSWTLKAGALVQANNGFAGIDEFDKMSDAARKSMHEALEDQQIPINKAGMNVTLPAKCSVLAGANPKYGRYDRYEALNEQIELGPTLIQRFDLVFGLTDPVDEGRDWDIAQHQLEYDNEDLELEIDLELLREYIAYARQNIDPEWDSQAVKDEVAEYYVSLRQDAAQDDNMAPGPRMNDALRRLSEASARARLSDTVEPQDVDRATSLMDYHIGQVALDENGEINAAQADGLSSIESQKEAEYDQLKPQIIELVQDAAMFPDQIARELGETENTVREYVERMAKRGDVLKQNGKVEAT